MPKTVEIGGNRPGQMGKNGQRAKLEDLTRYTMDLVRGIVMYILM